MPEVDQGGLPGGGDSSGASLRVELGPGMKGSKGGQERRQRRGSKEAWLTQGRRLCWSELRGRGGHGARLRSVRNPGGHAGAPTTQSALQPSCASGLGRPAPAAFVGWPGTGGRGLGVTASQPQGGAAPRPQTWRFLCVRWPRASGRVRVKQPLEPRLLSFGDPVFARPSLRGPGPSPRPPVRSAEEPDDPRVSRRLWNCGVTRRGQGCSWAPQQPWGEGCDG